MEGNDPEEEASPALPWGLEKKQMKPNSLSKLTDDKLARFVIGHQKKSKFERVCFVALFTFLIKKLMIKRFVYIIFLILKGKRRTRSKKKTSR